MPKAWSAVGRGANREFSGGEGKRCVQGGPGCRAGELAIGSCAYNLKGSQPMKQLLVRLGLTLCLSLIQATAQIERPPNLLVTHEADGKLRLRPAASGDFSLEETGSLTPPVLWHEAAVTLDATT